MRPQTTNEEEGEQRATSQEQQELSFSPSLDRREFLQKSLTATGIALTGSTFTDNPEPWERFARAVKRPSTLDALTVKHLETFTQSCWQLIPDVTGVASIHLRNEIVEHLNNVTELLEGPISDISHKRLCSIGSEFAMIAASMSSNLRDFRIAQAYYQVSIDAAHEARNAPLGAVGLASLAIRLTHLGHADKALPLVQEARRLTIQRGTLTTRTWLAAVEAEVQANLKEQHACFRALDDASSVPAFSSPKKILTRLPLVHLFYQDIKASVICNSINTKTHILCFKKP
jgi:hypothetical protein